MEAAHSTTVEEPLSLCTLIPAQAMSHRYLHRCPGVWSENTRFDKGDVLPSRERPHQIVLQRALAISPSNDSFSMPAHLLGHHQHDLGMVRCFARNPLCRPHRAVSSSPNVGSGSHSSALLGVTGLQPVDGS